MALSVSESAGLPSPPGPGMMPATYGFSALTPPSASVSSNAGSPQSRFQLSNGFGTSTSTVGVIGGVFDMQGMEMEFGGYGVPMADKKAMLRHFGPTISQDGQIGVDRDTMMMSAMPSTLETQDWETYLSSMLGIDAGDGNDNRCRWMGRFL